MNPLAGQKMIIQPRGSVSSVFNIAIWLPTASVPRAFDVRIVRCFEAAVARFFCLLNQNSLAIPAMSPIPKFLASLVSSRSLTGYYLDELRRFHGIGTEWFSRNASFPQRQRILKSWDELHLLCNIAADVNGLMLCRRMGHTYRMAVCFIEDPAADAPEAIATFERPGQGAIATDAGMPYVHNVWSSRSGLGAELLRFIRDDTRSASLLVNPLSEMVARYYRERHYGIPYVEEEFEGALV